MFKGCYRLRYYLIWLRLNESGFINDRQQEWHGKRCYTRLDIQKKPADVFISKSGIEIRNQENDLDKFPILDSQKRFLKTLKNFMRRDK